VLRTRFLVAFSLAAACASEEFVTPGGALDASVDAGPDVANDVAVLPDAAADAFIDAADAGVGCAFGKGTPMVRVDASAGAFCVEVTEVTESQFNDFANAAPPVWVSTDGGELCTGASSSSDFSATPLVTAPSLGPEFPVGAQWCAARAYCAWAGKRLCGSLVVGNAELGEFWAACSGNGIEAFGYGNAASESACAADAGLHPVGSVPTCKGGAPGVLDINGNRQEWVDGFGVDDAGTPNVYRYVRGLGGLADCSTLHGVLFGDTNMGFRCCADPRD
jgi:hypothetical protein